MTGRGQVRPSAAANARIRTSATWRSKARHRAAIGPEPMANGHRPLAVLLRAVRPIAGERIPDAFPVPAHVSVRLRRRSPLQRRQSGDRRDFRSPQDAVAPSHRRHPASMASHCGERTPRRGQRRCQDTHGCRKRRCRSPWRSPRARGSGQEGPAASLAGSLGPVARAGSLPPALLEVNSAGRIPKFAGETGPRRFRGGSCAARLARH